MLVYFNQATALSLRATVGQLAAATPLRLRLFSNDHTPAVDDTEADYTEVVGGGYAAKDLSAALWTVQADDPSAVSYPLQTFTFNGAPTPGTVYGYYVTDANGIALFAERLESPPFSPGLNDQLLVVLNLNDGNLPVILTNKFLVQGVADPTLSQAQFLGLLASGILKVNTVTGVLSVAVAGDFPTLNQNTSGTAANLSGTPALPNGVTATTQAASDNSTKLATTAYADAAGISLALLAQYLSAGPSGTINKVTVSATDAQIKAGGTLSLVVAAQANRLLIPLFWSYIGNAGAGSYNNGATFQLRYNGDTQALVSATPFGGGLARTRYGWAYTTALALDQTTFAALGKGLDLNISVGSTGGNAANYFKAYLHYLSLALADL